MKYASILLIILFNCITAQEVPPVINFDAETYNASNQNWAISQSSNKKIYVANNASLLVYNGASWKTYLSPNESILRSVKVINDRIYTGCFMEFGYWKEDNLAVLKYTSLSKKIKSKLKQDEQFWNVFKIDEWVVFQSLNGMYLYNTTSDVFKILSFEETITKSFKVNNTIYFQQNNKGFFKIESGKEVLVSEDEVLKKNRIVSVFSDNNKLLLLTENKGFYYLEDKFLTKSDILSEKKASQWSVYSSIRLKNKDFVLGTISNGLICLDSNGKIKFIINQDTGLQNNTILSLHEDVDSNIWLGLDNGISFVSPNSAYRIYNDSEGILGSVYTAQTFNGKLYVGTNQGLFYKSLNSKNPFILVKGTKGQVWSLNVINNTLFCGHNSGTFIVNPTGIKQISDIPGTWAIKKLKEQSEVLIQGNYSGLFILEPYEDIWRVKNKIKGFDYSSRYFELLGTEIFVNHEYKGIFKLQVDSSFSEVKKVTIDTLIKGTHSSIVKYNDQLLYAYKKGLFKYDRSQKKFVKDSVLSTVYTKQNYDSGKLVVHEKDNLLWVFSSSKISKIKPSISDNLKITDIFIDKRKRNSVLGYENIVKLNSKGDYLMGTLSGYIILNENQLSNSTFKVFIDEVIGNDIEHSNVIDKNTSGNFKPEENNIDISFFVPKFNSYLDTHYQYQLKGIYDEWSDWSKSANVKFKNLPYGDYTFNVRAKIGESISKNKATYTFKIQKPWYISTPMLIVYLLIVGLFSLFMHTAYKKYYKRQQQRLLLKTKRELELSKVQNEKAIIKIKNEQLELENKSKTKELAASTMGMIRKNEVLTNIKKELNKIADKKSVKPVIRLIDDNLKKNDDWLLFQEAFNNSDHDFLKNIKKSHPTLTPSDLKLCAYLRLNLSSKEIAQLFNISPRSVEIKRYRLRKKLNLKHEDNLVNYILEI